MHIAAYNHRVMGPAHVVNVADETITTSLARRTVSHILTPKDVQDETEAKDAQSSATIPEHSSDLFVATYLVLQERALRRAVDLINSGKKVAMFTGPNSALAGAAYTRSRLRKIKSGELAPVHCNSYSDGHWTDITRKWCAGEPDACAKDVFAAVFTACEAPLAAIRPAACDASVDWAARQKTQEHGLEAAFKHSEARPACIRRRRIFWSPE